MRILGIESSCDETAAAIVSDGNIVLSSIVLSQVDVHRVFGGVVPEVAAREHLKVIDEIVEEAFEKAGLTIDEIDAIAVTQGPGLIGALLVGISYAKGLALSTGKPLIPINHVHAHVLGALLGIEQSLAEIFPCIAAVVSGGHTNLYYMKSPTDFELLANTIDDACGESFDKVAKLLNLGYPGGPLIEKMARTGDASKFQMPRMVEQKNKLVFSYSGLKTHMVNLIKREAGTIDEQKRSDLCAAFQDEALGQLARKLKSALDIKPDTKTILIAGGVAANLRFRELIEQEIKIPALFPPLKFCGDNAAMIAAYGYHQYQKQHASDGIKPEENWDAYSRYRFTEGSK